MLFLTAAATTTSTAKPVSAVSLFFQLMLGLAVVLGLIWVGARVVKSRMGSSLGKRKAQPLAVLGRQPLGKGVQIALVKAGAEMYVLGVTAHQVTRLARYQPDPEETELESSDDLPPAVPAKSFAVPSPFQLKSSIRHLQERTLRRP